MKGVEAHLERGALMIQERWQDVMPRLPYEAVPLAVAPRQAPLVLCHS